MNMNSTNVKNGRPSRDSLPAKGAIPSKADHATTTPTTRNPDGFHRGTGKPTGVPAQWVLVPGAKLPPRAFEPHEKERERFWLIARSVPLNPDPTPEIERIGAAIFDATFAAECVRFESEIAMGQLELTRLNAERTRLEKDISETRISLEDLPPTVEEEQAEPCFPSLFSVKWWGFALALVLLLVSSGAAALQIANIYLPTMQSWLFSTVAALPWILAAVGGEIFLLLTLKSESQKTGIALRCALCVLLLGIAVWLTGLFHLAAPVDLTDVTKAFVIPERRWAVAGQLLCELAISWLLLTGMLRLLTFRRKTMPNENRRRISEHIGQISQELAALNKQLAVVLMELANPEGNLREWNNSRAAFIEEGITIVRLRKDDGALLAEIQHRRDENKRLLSQFST